MPSPSQYPLKVEYRDVNGILTWSAGYSHPRDLAVVIEQLRAAGGTNFRVFRDGADSLTAGLSNQGSAALRPGFRRLRGGIF